MILGEPFDRFIFSTYTETDEIISYFNNDYDSDYLHYLMMYFARRDPNLRSLDSRYNMAQFCIDYKGCNTKEYGYFYVRYGNFPASVKR